MKKINFLLTSLIMLITLVVFFVSTTHKNSKETKNKMVNSSMLSSNLALIDSPEDKSNLTPAEISGLVSRKEAIKMSIDLNLKFQKIWDNKIFNELSSLYSDQNDNILMFMIMNKVTNPQREFKIGEFKSKSTQLQYDYLLAVGRSSFENAIMVDYYLEKMAIKFLNYQLNETVTNKSIITKYEKQLENSQMHLDKIYKIIKSDASLYNLEDFLVKIERRENHHSYVGNNKTDGAVISNEMMTNSLIHYHNNLFQTSHFSSIH